MNAWASGWLLPVVVVRCVYMVRCRISNGQLASSVSQASKFIYSLFIHHHKTTMCLYRYASIVAKRKSQKNERTKTLAIPLSLSHPNSESVGRSVDVGFCRPLYRVWALRCGIHSNFFRSFWALRESRLSRVFGKYIKIPNRWLQSTARSVYLHLYNRDGRMFDHIDFSAIKLW